MRKASQGAPVGIRLTHPIALPYYSYQVSEPNPSLKLKKLDFDGYEFRVDFSGGL
jgi:hypothetical protein